MRFIRSFAGTVFLAGFALTGCSRAADDGVAACQAAQGDQDVIRECTKMIDAGLATPEQMAYAHMFRATARQKLGQAKAALDDSNAAVRLAPKDSKIVGNRGVILGMQGHPEESLRDLETAVALDPGDKLANGNLAIQYSKRGDFVKARKYVTHAIELDPAHPAFIAELCWVGAAGGDDPEQALADCNHAVETNPDANNFNSRGLAHYRLKRYAESIADYDRSLQRNPDEASSWYVRGLAKRAAGIEGAQADIDKALSLNAGVADRFAGFGIK
jgi:tetratricopeptide (TPR) repeat protein